jgi:hypothetical protein
MCNRVKFIQDRPTIAVYSLSEVADVIVTASASFIELVGVGDEAIDLVTTIRNL